RRAGPPPRIAAAAGGHGMELGPRAVPRADLREGRTPFGRLAPRGGRVPLRRRRVWQLIESLIPHPSSGIAHPESPSLIANPESNPVSRNPGRDSGYGIRFAIRDKG